MQKYDMSSVKAFFSKILGEPCTQAIICSQRTTENLPTSPLSRTYRSRLRRVFRPKTSWPRFSCAMFESNSCPFVCSVENGTPTIFRTSVQCESVTRSSEAENEHLIKTSMACREKQANIMVAEQTTRSTNEKYPFRQYRWPTIRIGPSEVQFESVPKIGPDDHESLEANRSSVSVSVCQFTSRITYENYKIRSSDGDNDRGKTIAAGDMALPVQWV